MRGLLVCAAAALALAPAAGAATGHVPFEAAFAAEAAGQWDFGDGTSAVGTAVRHVYREPGLYVVRLNGAVHEHVGAFRIRVAPEQLGRIAGRIEPALVGARVEAAGAVGATGRDGSFSLPVRVPGRHRALVAGLGSAEVLVRRRARIEARLVGPAVVGEPLRLEARVRPAGAGRLAVTVLRAGRVAYRGADGTLGLSTRREGPVEVRLALVPAEGWLAAPRTLRADVVAPRLGPGSRGAGVLALERRLRALRLALPSVDDRYGLETFEAVLAFQKLHGLPRTGRVDASTWRALRAARVPVPRYRGTHLEVSKGRQYLLVVRDSRVTDVVHVSTGLTGNTPIGSWRIYRKVPGWDWVLWYPLYFLRGFAVHGYPEVPAHPASHGCVRVPMWIAPRLYASFSHGQAVHVYW